MSIFNTTLSGQMVDGVPTIDISGNAGRQTDSKSDNILTVTA